MNIVCGMGIDSSHVLGFVSIIQYLCNIFVFAYLTRNVGVHFFDTWNSMELFSLRIFKRTHKSGRFWFFHFFLTTYYFWIPLLWGYDWFHHSNIGKMWVFSYNSHNNICMSHTFGILNTAF